MKKISLFMMALAVPVFIGVTRAESVEIVVISEIQTGTSSDSSAEFVELYNPTAEQVDLNGWRLEYKSATSENNWLVKAELVNEIPAHGFYLIATDGFSNADSAMSSGLAQAGGHVRLVDREGGVLDLVGWGSANAPEGNAAAAADGNIERLPGEYDQSGGNWYDTDNNAADFRARQEAEPQNSSMEAETPNPGFTPPAAEPEPISEYARLAITELLVDPVSPQTDAEDEFVELFNPGSESINLRGYRLETGSSFSYAYTFEDLNVGPGEYAAFDAALTGLTLSNSGGLARLLSPDGQEVSRTPAYTDAEAGQSWAELPGAWQWTASPTPGAANVYQPPATAAAPAVKKAAAKKTKAAKKKTAAKRRSSSPRGGVRLASAKTPAAPLSKGLQGQPAGKWLLVGLGGLTIAYATYEFRYDIQNIYRLARRKLGLGG